MKKKVGKKEAEAKACRTCKWLLYCNHNRPLMEAYLQGRIAKAGWDKCGCSYWKKHEDL